MNQDIDIAEGLDREFCKARKVGQPPETACQNKMPCPLHCSARCRDDEHGVRYCAIGSRDGRTGSFLLPNGRCRKHGGKSPRGPANGMYRHGMYSKVFPADMRVAYKRVRESPELLTLTGETAALTVKMQRVLAKMDEVDAPPWGDAVEALNDLMTARNRKDERGETEALAELNKVMREGAGAATLQSRLWAEFRELAQEKERLVTAERNWHAKLRTMYTAEQGLMLQMAIMEAAKQEFGDMPERLARYLDRALKLLDDPNKPVREVEAVDE